MKIIFCFGLALLKFNQSEILTKTDAVSISLLLRQIAADAHMCNSVLMVFLLFFFLLPFFSLKISF